MCLQHTIPSGSVTIARLSLCLCPVHAPRVVCDLWRGKQEAMRKYSETATALYRYLYMTVKARSAYESIYIQRHEGFIYLFTGLNIGKSHSSWCRDSDINRVQLNSGRRTPGTWCLLLGLLGLNVLIGNNTLIEEGFVHSRTRQHV